MKVSAGNKFTAALFLSRKPTDFFHKIEYDLGDII
jgi:hypothetical protein